jgi:hypothetical protein
MSSNRQELQLVLDNRVNVSADSVGLVEISATNANYFEIPADGGAVSYTSQILFSQIVTPSLYNTLVSRNPRLRYTVTVNVDTTVANGLVLSNPFLAEVNAPNAGLRAFPFQSVCDTVSLILNGSTTTINSRQVLSAIQRHLPKEFLKSQATECPCMPDNSALLITDADRISNQVLSSYRNSDGTTRGSFNPINLYYNTPADGFGQGHLCANYVFDVSEPILMSPFSLYDRETFLANINTMSLYFNFSNVKDMFVASGTGVAPASFQVSLSNAQLELTYLQVSNDIVQIPRLVSFPYENITYFPRTTPVGWTAITQPAGDANATLTYQSATITSDTLRFSSMPELIYIINRIPLQNRTGTTQASTILADCFAGLGDLNGKANFQVNIGTKSGQLATASVKTIWRMSVANGSNQSWNEFLNNGAVVIINPVKDLGIDLSAGDILPSENGYVNFQVNMMINNQPFLQSNYLTAIPNIETLVIPVYKGTVNLTPDGCIFSLGELSHREIETALKSQPKDGSMVSNEVFQPTVKAGSLFGSLKSLVGKGASAIKSAMANPMVQQGIDYLASQHGGGMTAAGLKKRR